MRDQIRNAFRAEFGSDPTVVTRAPGRLEILGNHTDYNEGLVLSAAVERAAFVAAAAVPGRECQIRDVRLRQTCRFHLDRLADPKSGDWGNYVKGIVVELQHRGVDVPAFRAVLHSTVPLSAGMSSSAALEISVAYALGRLARVEYPWLEWARIGQGCENRYVGAMTGLMDQFSSIRGRPGQLVLSDFRTLEVKNVPLPAATALVVANSMTTHTLTEEYNDRRASCERAVAVLRQAFPDVRALRDVNRERLDACRAALEDADYRRAAHVVDETERVRHAVRALHNGDAAALGQQMFASHESSRCLFENSSAGLDILVEEGRRLPGCLGARLSGGGFGGITVHLVAAPQSQAYADGLRTAFRARTDLEPDLMICQPGPGAAVLDSQE